MNVKKKISAHMPTKKTQNTKLVSVIVPAYNSGEYLEKNIKLALKQTLANIEIIIVNDGSTDNTAKIAKKLALFNSRVRLVDKVNGGVSSARNAGVAAAKGEYIFFLDPDDYMDNDTLEVLYNSLETSGSDVAITGYDLIYDEKPKQPGVWIQKLFSQSKQKFRVEEFPAVLQASTPWGKLIRHSYYREADLGFMEGIVYEDQPFTATLYSRAKNGIDIIGAHKMHWVQLDSSISHQTTVDDLKSRVEAARLALEILGQFAPKAVEPRLVQNLNNDLRYIMRRYNKVDDEYNALIFSELPKFYHLLDDKTQLDAIVDVAYRLLDNDEYEVFDQLLFATNISNHKLKLVNDHGTPVVDWSTLAYIDNFSSEGHVLHEIFQPRIDIDKWEMTSEGPKISLNAFITKIDAHEFDYKVRLKLVKFDEKTGEEFETVAELDPIGQYDAPYTIREHKEWWADYSPNFYEFQLPAVFDTFNECIKLKVEISAGNLFFEKDVSGRRNNATGRWANLTLSETSQLRIKHSTESGKQFYYLKYVPIATYSVDKVEGQQLTMTVHSGAQLISASVHSKVRFNRKNVRVKLIPVSESDENNVYRVVVNMKKLRQNKLITDYLTPLRHDFRLSFKNQNGNRILGFIKDDNPIVLADINTVITNVAQGSARFVGTRVIEVKSAHMVPGFLKMRVFVRNHGPQSFGTTLSVKSGDLTRTMPVTLVPNEVNEIELPLNHDVFGEMMALPLLRFSISFKNTLGRDENVIYDEAFIRTLPDNVYDNGYQISRLEYNYSAKKLYFQLFNKLHDDNKGGYGWGRMMTKYQNSTAPVDPKKILFRTYYGESVTDNAVALTHEILLDPALSDIEIYWAVQNPSVVVPEGTHQVIINSDEWFDLLATAGTVVENVHQVDYMVKKPGQRIVQAFHGYPYKQMGRDFFLTHGFDMSRVKSFQRREAEWDYILSPAPYATPLYQRNFNFKGEMLEVGHPRNDILVDPERAAERELINKRVRERLNIPADKKIVLYAPTFRDYASDNEFKSNRVDFVSYDDLAKKLGDEYVLLIRGHAMNRRAGNTVSTASGIDATTYPEILDLIIASDMAVLDYSSLRFDYAQTGKPMIFFVPDLDLYEETRGGLMPYLPTAPGWIVNSESELIQAITHSDDYMNLYGDAWRTFRRDYTSLDDGHAGKRMIDKLFK
ncbi:bifunctional glycosyltransferase/CDP-glycerol:glycerophosphate glycerophosphotransferase [Weissella tructae]|uniref:CDP-glycerol:poly(Glycerophosphate) glycerophosphotransferase n=3 Tax=Weissella TaxID=46255 RepID=A0A075TVB7_9LACO|nr:MULTISPECIES: CDP-glycerol glycerophosphotransferase family protein [Weissella]AIG65494.1 CDP-glycerol:poly(Glycerophosphate) glycerophosphotransferase [Weissella tructae]AIM62808.1 CDP-glycerol:poly(Glycerophosphate) glycerophosphotransferase [Weissella ceti]AIM64143.1 CDP-glycerol:poly(Glycerophosphate) glycerophosphotransferase [Weissella ceti]ELA07047.1 CDP-glycerol:poly(glycerophosphate)glycerophosphotransferase [Weissella ceti NC36]QVV91867.1 CDP-glycerol glycerophosphotransferase fam